MFRNNKFITFVKIFCCLRNSYFTPIGQTWNKKNVAFFYFVINGKISFCSRIIESCEIYKILAFIISPALTQSPFLQFLVEKFNSKGINTITPIMPIVHKHFPNTCRAQLQKASIPCRHKFCFSNQKHNKKTWESSPLLIPHTGLSHCRWSRISNAEAHVNCIINIRMHGHNYTPMRRSTIALSL